jgi:hypothetical protein
MDLIVDWGTDMRGLTGSKPREKIFILFILFMWVKWGSSLGKGQGAG